MASASSILIGTIWPSYIPLRIWALFNIYKILEFLLMLLHDSGIINLGPVHALFLRRNALASTLHHAVYLPLSPIINALCWGVVMKCTMVPGFWRFASPTVAVIALGVAGIWLRSGCFPDNGGSRLSRETRCCAPTSRGDVDGAATLGFARPCVEAVFGVALSFVLIVASWRGWTWDFGVMDWVLRDPDESSGGKAERELEERKEEDKSEKKRRVGSLEG